MKRIMIKSLVLKNWRGLNVDVTFNSETTRINGRNGIGKSSIMKAWFWLMTGFPSSSETKNFNLFDNREEITPDTPKAIVTARITIDDEEYVIEKQAVAKFTRKRGSNEYEKSSSDTYNILIDNVDVSCGDFDAWIENHICPPEMLPYVLSGSFLTSLFSEDKNKARNILESIIGEINDSDMKGDYSLISEDLKKWSVDDIEKKSKNELKPLMDRQKELPVVIENKESLLSDYRTTDFEEILEEIIRLKKEISDIDNRILGNGESIKPIIDKRDTIFDCINDKTLFLNSRKAAYMAQEMAKVSELKAKLGDAIAFNSSASQTNIRNNAKRVEINTAIQNIQEEIERRENVRKKLLEERDEIKNMEFNEYTCPYCGAEIPYERLEKAKDEFNKKKINALNDVVRRGRTQNEWIEDAKNKLANYEQELLLLKDIDTIDTCKIEYEISVESAKIIPFEQTSEYSKMVEEIEALKASIPDIPKNDNESLTNMKKCLMDKVDELNRQYGIKGKADNIEKEIEELRKERRYVGEEIAKLEGKIDKCREYRQERADITSQKINCKLCDCKIDMWTKLKDGTIVPDTVFRGHDDVKFGSLNFSNQIKATVELQKLFMKSFDVIVPIFIDEYSVFSSDNKPDVDDYQSICLSASDSKYIIVE